MIGIITLIGIVVVLLVLMLHALDIVTRLKRIERMLDTVQTDASLGSERARVVLHVAENVEREVCRDGGLLAKALSQLPKSRSKKVAS